MPSLITCVQFEFYLNLTSLCKNSLQKWYGTYSLSFHFYAKNIYVILFYFKYKKENIIKTIAHSCRTHTQHTDSSWMEINEKVHLYKSYEKIAELCVSVIEIYIHCIEKEKKRVPRWYFPWIGFFISCAFFYFSLCIARVLPSSEVSVCEKRTFSRFSSTTPCYYWVSWCGLYDSYVQLCIRNDTQSSIYYQFSSCIVWTS